MLVYNYYPIIVIKVILGYYKIYDYVIVLNLTIFLQLGVTILLVLIIEIRKLNPRISMNGET